MTLVDEINKRISQIAEIVTKDAPKVSETYNRMQKVLRNLSNFIARYKLHKADIPREIIDMLEKLQWTISMWTEEYGMLKEDLYEIKSLNEQAHGYLMKLSEILSSIAPSERADHTRWRLR